MSSESWKLEKDLCRCCHAEGSFTNLGNPVKPEEEKNYATMLRECLTIDLSRLEDTFGDVTYTICEECILRLQDANNFKKQVLVCEERFKDMCSRGFIKVMKPLFDDDIKMETDYDYKIDYSGSNCDDAHDEDFDEDVNPAIESIKKKSLLRAALEGLKNNDTVVIERKSKSKSKSKQKRKSRLNKSDCDVNDESKVAKRGKEKGSKQSSPKFRLLHKDYKYDGKEYQCIRCEKKYDNMCSLRFHVKTKHYNIAQFKCNHCDKGFMTLAPLTVHKLEEHAIDDRFKCLACKGAFNTKVQLKKHLNNFHMMGERHKCEYCEYESFSFEGMYKHKFKHKTVKDYHCKFCRKSFLRKATLDLHERIHTGDRRKVCKECGQAFVQKASLNYHMTKYHPEVNF